MVKLGMLLVLIVGLAGCAIGVTPDGGLAGPFVIPGSAVEHVPEAVGGAVTAATGNPALGAIVGGIATTAIAGLGWARSHATAKAAKAEHQGERKGWDESEQAAVLARASGRAV